MVYDIPEKTKNNDFGHLPEELNIWAPLLTSFMVKTIFFENLFNNMLRHTALIACLAGLLWAIAAKATGRHGRQACPASRGRRVSQIATAIFLPRPDAKALGDSVCLGGFGLRRTASSLA